MAELWSGMFHLGVPVLAKILRPIIVYFFLVFGVRLGRQTATGATESVRFGRAAHVSQHGAERHYRRR